MKSLLAAFAVLLMVAPASAATAIGKVGRLQGEATASADGIERALAAEAPVHLDEVIVTGKKAVLELNFDDGTLLTIGAEAKLKLDVFVYNPAGPGSRLNFVVVGPFRFISGKLGRIGKIGANDVSVRTPFATVGIRGTDFWGGPIDGRFGIFLIEGAVSVQNSGGGAMLDEAGEGVNIDGAGETPGAVTRWPQDKIDRAMATVTFR